MNALADPAEPLLRLAEALGDRAPDFSNHEQLLDIRFYDKAFSASWLDGLDFETLVLLKEAYGDALKFKILRGDLPLLDLNEELDEAVFEHFQERLAPSQSVVVDIVLDKQAYARQTFGDFPESCHAVLYVFPERLNHYLLSAKLTDLEKDLWPERTAKTIILVPGLEIWMDGPLLSVFGGRYTEDWHEAFSDAPDTSRAERIFADASDLLRWEERWLAYLTPLHLALQSKVGASAVEGHLVVDALRMHLANAILLYTAERTVWRDGFFVSTYATTRAIVEVPHLSTKILRDGNTTASILAKGLDGLRQTFEWAYAVPWGLSERLPVVQIAIVNALRAAPPEQRSHVLLSNAEQIHDNLKWTWREFLDDQFDAFLSQVQQVEAYVSETVSSHSQQVTELVKSVSETMLAAVGVTIVSFVAALFKDNFDATVFRIGIWAYVAYVFFFPLLYSLGNQVSRYKALERQFQRRRERFEQRLHPYRVADIVGNEVQDSRQRFWTWFWITAAIYILVIALAIFAAYAVPIAFAPSAPSS